ncbi:YifB family Mg chelatase-like AAA ATPase [Ralstonia pickettii]|nr:YifB family Mg chelatase-like AAA ATPase [Ralstonia pickettii]
MATIVTSIGLKGLEGYRVFVEVQLIPGMSGARIVGLPEASVKEAKDRVLTALYANNCLVHNKKIVINLSPAEQRKNSPVFDLAIAIGVMKEMGAIRHPIPEGAAFLGLLSLDGKINSVDGMLPAVIAAKKEEIKILYLPEMDDLPLQFIEGIELRFVETLQQVIESFSGQLTGIPTLLPSNITPAEDITPTYEKDFSHVLGHKKAKRALEIAAGGHNLLMIGPPGCGKSLLAETFSSILPTLKPDRRIEVMSIYQLAGVEKENFFTPPFREPHHSSSAVSLVGGGSNPKPGEVSLAHRGVLFLDEMAEFPKKTLDMLRQPMESGFVTISRAASTVTYPSQFLMLGAMNPCPCGYLGSKYYYCTCTPKQITAYNNRVSGPIKDRMDILLNLEVVSLERGSSETNETSKEIHERVIAAREKQFKRYGAEITNAIVADKKLLACSKLNDRQEKMMQEWTGKFNWSTRVQMKILRMARTISDLEGKERITNKAIWEAVTMRQFSKERRQLGVVK